MFGVLLPDGCRSGRDAHTVMGFQEVFTSTLPEEASLCILLKFANIVLLCPKLNFTFVSSLLFIPHTLYSVMQVDNENVYL